MALSSSNLGLPSDWAVVSASESPEQENESESNIDALPNSNDPVCQDPESNPPVGSHVQNVVEEPDFLTQNDSTSSSDIDIIDENALDDSLETRTYIRPNLSISSTSESSSAAPEIPPVPAAETGSTVNQDENRPNNWQSWVDFSMNVFDRLTRLYEMFGARDRRNVAVSFLVLIATYSIVKNPTSPIKPKTNIPNELQELIKQLELENKNLKNQVLLEMQNDKIFSALEGQMKELKNENRKLQEFIQSLQKQSTAESNSKKETQNFYQKEINYLKELVNLLQFDNEELQNQLVRMRYSSHSSKTDSGKEEIVKEENSSETLSNEVKELRKDLQNEISKLKKLNELIENLTKELLKFETKESFSDEKEPLHEGTRKDGKRSNSGWSFQLINIPDLFKKYVSNSKTPLEDAFKNIGNFFKAAQKEINSHKAYFKDHWDKNFVSTREELREQWSKLKHQFFNRDDDTENEDNKPEFSNTFTEKDPERMKHNVDGHNKLHNKHKVGKKGFHAMDNDKRDDKGNSDETIKDDLASDSWVFGRAAERAKLREKISENPLFSLFFR